MQVEEFNDRVCDGGTGCAAEDKECGALTTVDGERGSIFDSATDRRTQRIDSSRRDGVPPPFVCRHRQLSPRKTVLIGDDMKLRGPVLVGTDFSPASDEALREGRQLADDLGTELMVCHVLPEVMHIRMLFPQWGGVDANFQKALGTKAAEAMNRQLEAVLGSARREATALIDAGSPHAGLLFQADAAGAGIIVVGAGKAADRVVRHARVPVLIARASPRGPVIGATDFSDPSLPALETAATEALRRRAAVHLLHVVDVGVYAIAGAAEMGFAVTPSSGSDLINNLRAAAQADLQTSLDRFAVDGEVHSISGRAADTIISHAGANRAQLVVVGTHGRTGWARLTLGSTAEQVIERSPCSVLVVRLSR
jgi:nucleotide-binding universal stress UspA family protein